MKSATMAESATPEACICAIFSLAGWEKLQPSRLKPAPQVFGPAPDESEIFELPYCSTGTCFLVMPTTSVRAYCSLILLGTSAIRVPKINTMPPAQIQQTSGNTYA